MKTDERVESRIFNDVRNLFRKQYVDGDDFTVLSAPRKSGFRFQVFEYLAEKTEPCGNFTTRKQAERYIAARRLLNVLYEEGPFYCAPFSVPEGELK